MVWCRRESEKFHKRYELHQQSTWHIHELTRGLLQIAAADLQTQARALGTTVSSTVSTTIQTGTKVASTTFNRFVEGDDAHPRGIAATGDSAGSVQRGPAPDKQDFWDDFSATAEQRMAGKAKAKANAQGPEPDKLDFWDDFAAAGEQRMAAKRQEPVEKKEFWDEFSAIGGSSKPSVGAGMGAGGQKSSVGTAAMSKRKPQKGDDEWSEW